jgi:hypothetical protein
MENSMFTTDLRTEELNNAPNAYTVLEWVEVGEVAVSRGCISKYNKKVGRSLVHGMARPQVADGGDGLQIWRAAAKILNKQSRTAEKGWLSSLGTERGANNFSP